VLPALAALYAGALKAAASGWRAFRFDDELAAASSTLSIIARFREFQLATPIVSIAAADYHACLPLYHAFKCFCECHRQA